MNSNIEKMGEFFNSRADGYDEHMLTISIEYVEFYDSISNSFDVGDERVEILDLGCGTGNELKGIFNKLPNAKITGIDLAENMTQLLISKYPDKAVDIDIIIASFADMEFEKHRYDYCVSVQAMHHYKSDKKIVIYRNIADALKPDGSFILGDYVVEKDEMIECLMRYDRLVRAEPDNIYHIDIPFTVEEEISILNEAGFKKVEIMHHKKNGVVIKSDKK